MPFPTEYSPPTPPSSYNSRSTFRPPSQPTPPTPREPELWSFDFNTVESKLIEMIKSKRWHYVETMITDQRYNNKTIKLSSSITDGFKRNILHWACITNAPLHPIISWLCSVIDDPMAAMNTPDTHGYTPLHYLIETNANEPTTTDIIKSYHQGKSDKISPSLFSSNLSSQSSKPQSIFSSSFLSPQPPSQLSPSLLHMAIINGTAYDLIHAILTNGKQSTVTASSYMMIYKCDGNNDTPLDLFFYRWSMGLRHLFETHHKSRIADRHCLIDGMATVPEHGYDGHAVTVAWLDKVATLLLEVATRDVDRRGQRDKQTNATPDDNNDDTDGTKTRFSVLRAALSMKQCPWSFVRMIMERHPEELQWVDSRGNYPLHTALGMTSVSSWDGELYDCSGCQRTFNNSRWYQHGKVLTDKFCEECFMSTDNDGWSNTGMRMKEYRLVDSLDKIPLVITDLINLNTDLLGFPDSNGRLPLHLMIEKTMTTLETGIQTVIKAAPAALSSRDPTTHLYPFMSQAAMTTSSRDGILSRVIAYVEGVGGNRQSADNEVLRLRMFRLCYELLMECPHLVSPKE